MKSIRYCLLLKHIGIKLMKIALLHPGSGETGAPYSATKIAAEIDDRGHDVTVFYVGDPPRPESNEMSFERESLPVRKDFLRSRATDFNKAIRAAAEDIATFEVIHSYIPRSIPSVSEFDDVGTVVTLNAYGGVCPKNTLYRFNSKHCSQSGPIQCSACSAHDSIDSWSAEASLPKRLARVPYHTYKNMGAYQVTRQSKASADAIDAYYAISDHVKSAYINFGFPKKKISVIPNLLEESFLRDHESNFDPPYKLLYVGGLKKHKGVEKLPAVVERLQSTEAGPFQMSIVGDGPLADDLVRAVQESGVTDSVDLRGLVAHKQLPSVYASHDLFVYPGEWEEPFGRVFLESLATGTPIVGSDVGIINKLTKNCGLVTDGTVAGLTQAVRDAVSADLRTWSDRAQQHALQYHPDKLVPQVEQLYHNVSGAD